MATHTKTESMSHSLVINMGDKAGARSILEEVIKEGSPSQAQRDQAAELEAKLG